MAALTDTEKRELAEITPKFAKIMSIDDLESAMEIMRRQIEFYESKRSSITTAVRDAATLYNRLLHEIVATNSHARRAMAARDEIMRALGRDREAARRRGGPDVDRNISDAEKTASAKLRALEDVVSRRTGTSLRADEFEDLVQASRMLSSAEAALLGQMQSKARDARRDIRQLVDLNDRLLTSAATAMRRLNDFLSIGDLRLQDIDVSGRLTPSARTAVAKLQEFTQALETDRSALKIAADHLDGVLRVGGRNVGELETGDLALILAVLATTSAVVIGFSNIFTGVLTAAFLVVRGADAVKKYVANLKRKLS